MTTSNKPEGLKRKRDPTFVTSEKMALIDLVHKYFDTVESKKTDAVSSRNKNIQWQKIAEEFNSSSPIHPRDWTVLKNCWENLKKKAKTEQTARNQHHIGTGGGPPRKHNTDPAIERVLEMIHTRVSGFINKYDSDGTQIIASGSNTIQSQISEEHFISSNDASTSEYVVPDTIDAELVIQDTNRESTETTDIAGTLTYDWSQYTPSMLRGPISSSLRVSRSPSLEVECRVEPQRQQASTTPPRAHTSSEATRSRRRPVLRSTNSQNETLNAERMKTLLKTNAHAEEEHVLQIKILQLQEQREQEILNQEKLKTEQEEIKLEILKIQLKKLQE